MLSGLLKKVNDLRCRAWDLIHGVETCGEIPLSSLDFTSENKSPGLEYQSHHPKVLRHMLSVLDIQHERYCFIDFGCGKGRVLLVAEAFPFRRILGVEFAPQLAEIARHNLRNYRGHRMCRDVTALTMDATEYELPREPAVLFFYSPFVGPVMEKVVANIEDSLRRHPRELFILFTGVTGMRERAFGSRPLFEKIRRERYFDVYRYKNMSAQLRA
jgi:SAM-dependent methyltransferase